MDFEITSDKRNELLSRREVQFTLKYDGATPSRMQIIGKLCALLNVEGFYNGLTSFLDKMVEEAFVKANHHSRLGRG